MPKTREERNAYQREWQRAHPRTDLSGPEYREKMRLRMKAKRAEDPEGTNSRSRAWKAANPDRVRGYNLRRYGIGPDDFAAMVKAQDGRCAICRQVPQPDRMGRAFQVDHCHKSGKVRALLCTNCNLMLGNGRDDIAILEAGIAYLREHGI